MVVGISMVRDEADIVEHTLRRMAGEVDQLIVADNGSTDGTREILTRLAFDLPLTVLDDRDPAYFQSLKMTALAARAAAAGADWVLPFDADEQWYSPFGRIGDILDSFPHATATATLFDHVATGADPDIADPVDRIRWRRTEPGVLPKIACRPRIAVRIDAGNHSATYENGVLEGQLVVRHFPYRSAEQFVSKARNGAQALAATDLPEDSGAHWRAYGRLLDTYGEEALHDVFREWFWSAAPSRNPGLIFDRCPSYR